MASLLTLPTELKETIIHQIPRTDILSLSKTCRAMQAVAYPALYRTVTFTWENSLTLSKPSLRLISLIRTVLKTPYLAAHVRTVELIARDIQYDEMERAAIGLESIPGYDQQLFSEAFSAAGICERNNIGGMIALLLMNCEKLEELVIDKSCPPAVEFTSENNWRLSQNLTMLRFRQCTAPSQTLARFLEHIPNLQKLNYDALLPSSTTPLDCNLVHDAIHHFRNSLTDLVVRYDLFADQAEDPENLVRVCAGSLGSLRDLARLESVQVSLAVLFGQVKEVDAPSLADMLPTSLRHLTICDDLWGYDAFAEWEGRQIMAVLKAFFSGEKRVDGQWNAQEDDYDFEWERVGDPAWKSATPRLEEFVLDIRKRGHQLYYCWDMEQNEEVKNMCKDQGIKCEILALEYN